MVEIEPLRSMEMDWSYYSIRITDGNVTKKAGVSQELASEQVRDGVLTREAYSGVPLLDLSPSDCGLVSLSGKKDFVVRSSQGRRRRGRARKFWKRTLDHALRQTGKTCSELKNISQNRGSQRDLLLFELQD